MKRRVPSAASAPWHHGNLREALVDAADALVTEGGRGNVSLRSVAQRVAEGEKGLSVAHTAAFAHVGGQLELLTNVAAKGWKALADTLASVSDAGDPAARLVDLGATYRRFATEHPHHFRLMYDAEIWREIEKRSGRLPQEPVGSAAVPKGPKSKKSVKGTEGTKGPKVHKFLRTNELDQVQAFRDEAFSCFVDTVIAGVREGSLRQDHPPDVMARAVASLSHGLAMEALDEGLAEAEVVPLLRLVVDGLRQRST